MYFQSLLTKYNYFAGFLVTISLLTLGCLVLPDGGFKGDIEYWIRWTIAIKEHGISKVYTSTDADYLPAYYYILWLYGVICGSEQVIIDNINYLKLFTLSFELSLFVFSWILLFKKTGNGLSSLWRSLLFILNVLLLYNSLFWGQVDSIQTALIVFAAYFAWCGSINKAIIFSFIALLFKLQVLIFLPIIFLIAFPHLVKQFNYKNLLKWLLSAIVTLFVLLMPWIIDHSFSNVWDTVFNSFSKYPVVSLYALNHWHWYFDDPSYIQDSEKFGFLTYNQIGLILFAISYIILLLPLLIAIIKSIISKRYEISISFETLLLILAMANFFFYFMNTQMHERYIHPTLVCVALYTILKGKQLWVYGVLSIVVFLNLELLLNYCTALPKHTLIFNRVFLSVLYFGLLCVLSYSLKQQYKELKNTKVVS